jgi:hypothetical protein
LEEGGLDLCGSREGQVADFVNAVMNLGFYEVLMIHVQGLTEQLV